jgi:hypothetical protein
MLSLGESHLIKIVAKLPKESVIAGGYAGVSGGNYSAAWIFADTSRGTKVH